MSYDLFFQSRSPEVQLPLGTFTNFFRERFHYKVEGTQAWYENEATGVYFSFDHGSEEEPVNPEANGTQTLASFNLNFYRPHIFALEAEPEVRAFVENFQLLVEDPQTNGMGTGEYSRDGFIRGWNHGNEFGYRAILTGDNAPDQMFSLATEKIESCWRWNHNRETLQNQLGDTVFVPRIMFLEQSGKIESSLVWGDAIPIAIPKVDRVLIPRKQLAPIKLIGERGDMVVLEWNRLLDYLNGFEKVHGPVEYYLLNYVEPPPRLTSAIKALKPFLAQLNGVRVDQILNSELIEQSHRK